jgi:hypothetical protein
MKTQEKPLPCEYRIAGFLKYGKEYSHGHRSYLIAVFQVGSLGRITTWMGVN